MYIQKGSIISHQRQHKNEQYFNFPSLVLKEIDGKISATFYKGGTFTTSCLLSLLKRGLL